MSSRPIPNAFTKEPTIQLSIETSDGKKHYGFLSKSEFEEWMESGGDPDDLFPPEDEDEKRKNQ